MASRPDAWNCAVRLVSRQELSEGDLRVRLQRKGFDSEEINQAIERCRSYGYVNDERYAQLRARQLLSTGRAIGPALLADLKQHSISEAVAHQAMATLEEEFNQTEVLRTLCQRRFPDFDFQTADDRTRRRVFNYLGRRGFAPSALFQYFNEER